MVLKISKGVADKESVYRQALKVVRYHFNQIIRLQQRERNKELSLIQNNLVLLQDAKVTQEDELFTFYNLIINNQMIDTFESLLQIRVAYLSPPAVDLFFQNYLLQMIRDIKFFQNKSVFRVLSFMQNKVTLS